MEKVLLAFALVAVGSFVNSKDAEGRQLSSGSFYITNPTQNYEDHIRFPGDGSTLADLDAAESIARLQGLQFFTVQNGNIPLIIYPISNGGETSSESKDDLHRMETVYKSQAKSSEGSSSAFEESLKNVAHGYIFPSSPETSHTDIFKQLMEAGSHGPAPEPYIIPTPQMNKPVEPDPIIAIPIPAINIYKEEDGQQSLLTTYNMHQIATDPMLLSQNIDTVENQQQNNPQYPTDINAIPLELQYLKDKPSHYHMVGPHQFLDDSSTESPAENEMPLPPPPFRDTQNPPLQPPPPMKASTYGPPKPMHGSTPGNHGNRYRAPINRPPSPPHPPPYPPKGNSPHGKVPTKLGQPHPFRLHPGPHQHHGGHHHHGHQHHHHGHHHPEPHYHHHHHDDHHRPPPKFPHYEVHEVKGHPGGHSHSNRPSSSHKHPYSFHYHSPPKQGSVSGPPPRGSVLPGPPRPPFPNLESPSKPNLGFGPQKGSQPYGPPKSSSYNPLTNTNLVTSHPSITKVIYHSSEQTTNQIGEYSHAKDSYPPSRPEYSIEISPTTHSTPHQRPSDVPASGSISDSYVTGPPRVNYPDEEEEEEPSPPVEVYNSPSDGYQRGKQPLKAPVIVYKGVRPPVRVYQKPETGPPYHHLPNPHAIRGSQTSAHPLYSPSIESTWVNSASPPYYHQQRVRGSYSVASPKSTETSLTKSSKETLHITTASPFRYSPGAPSTGSSSSSDSFSSSSDDSSSWTPINAPAGAVPARGYHMPAPDLSRGISYPTNHNSYYSSANSRADVEDLVLTDQSGSSHSLLSANNPLTTGGGNQMRLENNSEEVVSAVVLVKHR